MLRNSATDSNRHWLSHGPFLPILVGIGLFSVLGSARVYGQPNSANLDQDLPAADIGPIPMVCDVHQYEADSGKTAVEVVLALDILRTECPEVWSLGSAVLSIGIRISDSSFRILGETRLRKVLTFSETDRTADRITFVDLERFLLFPDSVLVSVSVQDSASGKSASLKRPLLVRNLGEGFSLSDLYFISRPQRGGGHAAFEKHGVFLVPNPGRIYDASGDSSAVWVYFEINHLPSGPEGNPLYQISITIEDNNGTLKKSQDRGPIRAGAASTSRLEKILLDGLPAGSHTLVVTVIETGSGQSRTTQRKFWVKSPAVPPSFPDQTADREKIRRLIRPIATPEEKKIFTSLTDQGLQEFLLRFWKARDPDPRTAENEFMVEHLRRFTWADNRFAGGAESDMGRIYIVYGPPIDVQREFSTIEYSKPVEIWYYGIEGRVEFVFIDRSGDGLYRLVHSTHKDEFSNPDWMEEYQP